MLTREYPPHVYGGAGVHVTELVKALRHSCEVRVHCFGPQRPERDSFSYDVPPNLTGANPVLQTLAIDIDIAAGLKDSQLTHSHTWYANEAGRLAQSIFGTPHVVTAHSLEPLRPWKAEQLGGGYHVSRDIEARAFASADAIIAVSAGMRGDILRCYPNLSPERIHVVHNGIDTKAWSPIDDPTVLTRFGIEPSVPTIAFVGRITRQKGLTYFLRAVADLPDEIQIVLCAGAPDTPEIMAEISTSVSELSQSRGNIVWITEQLPRHDLAAVLSAATVFACPSIYEPLGIVNLEAMACGLPVVGTKTGGIPEVIVDGETGWLVPIDQVDDGTGTPINEQEFIAAMAQTLRDAVSDIPRARRMGQAARRRAEDHFAWDAIAAQTRAVYEEVLSSRAR